ncbi:hypothetical protein [Acidithiobacillus ferriphilus]|uniref:hypothetical protein n=1 Tax=Acidithiobacillus ferriphilus TaxID=1689834 RepID=UPI002DBC4EAB|nr:hypothetical protein [Acidithiobacillus ferriphilus]MEB8536820.1 hypothetical protein [Acidithiobacillus ferriphilus]
MKNDTEKLFTPEQNAQAWAFLHAIVRGENPPKPDFFPDIDRAADQEVDRRERSMRRATVSLEQHIKERRALHLISSNHPSPTPAVAAVSQDDGRMDFDALEDFR